MCLNFAVLDSFIIIIYFLGSFLLLELSNINSIFSSISLYLKQNLRLFVFMYNKNMIIQIFSLTSKIN